MASPSDVRWRLCPTGNANFFLPGAAPALGALPQHTYELDGRSETFRTSGGKAVIQRALAKIGSNARVLQTLRKIFMPTAID